jgi:hypothetical protein
MKPTFKPWNFPDRLDYALMTILTIGLALATVGLGEIIFNIIN